MGHGLGVCWCVCVCVCLWRVWQGSHIYKHPHSGSRVLPFPLCHRLLRTASCPCTALATRIPALQSTGWPDADTCGPNINASPNKIGRSPLRQPPLHAIPHAQAEGEQDGDQDSIPRKTAESKHTTLETHTTRTRTWHVHPGHLVSSIATHFLPLGTARLTTDLVGQGAFACGRWGCFFFGG